MVPRGRAANRSWPERSLPCIYICRSGPAELAHISTSGRARLRRRSQSTRRANRSRRRRPRRCDRRAEHPRPACRGPDARDSLASACVLSVDPRSCERTPQPQTCHPAARNGSSRVRYVSFGRSSRLSRAGLWRTSRTSETGGSGCTPGARGGRIFAGGGSITPVGSSRAPSSPTHADRVSLWQTGRVIAIFGMPAKTKRARRQADRRAREAEDAAGAGAAAVDLDDAAIEELLSNVALRELRESLAQLSGNDAQRLLAGL